MRLKKSGNVATIMVAIVMLAAVNIFGLGMGYRVEGLVYCTDPDGKEIITVTEQFIQTQCETWRIFGCDDQLVLPMTDVSEYGECRLRVISGFDPITVTLTTPNGVPVPLEYPNFTAKAGRHSQLVCTHWFPVEENGGKFEAVVSNYGPAGRYAYKIILECLREKPTDGGTKSRVQEGPMVPKLVPR